MQRLLYRCLLLAGILLPAKPHHVGDATARFRRHFNVLKLSFVVYKVCTILKFQIVRDILIRMIPALIVVVLQQTTKFEKAAFNFVLLRACAYNYYLLP